MADIRLDTYVLDVLMRDLVGHDRKPSSFIVYLYMWRLAAASRRLGVAISHRRLAEGTGLSKSTVQAAIRELLRRRLLHVVRASPTAVPEYRPQRPWLRR